MHFRGDAFISYAHLDNQELVEGRKGWVANLHRALEIRVGQLLGKQPEIWRDPKLAGNDLFADALVDRLRGVAILVTVVSPRYLKSEWTLRELNEFWAAAQEQGGIHIKNKARVFKVLKTPVALDRTPSELQSLIGYEFFKEDPETGKIRELDEVFGADAHRDFWLRLDDLAHDICSLLESIEEAESGPHAVATGASASGTGDAVYLADTTSDLREDRESLRRDLQQHGYIVLPDRPLPYVAHEAEAIIREDLARCRMSVHFIGKNYGAVPEGGAASLVEIQHELATARSEEGRLARLIWIPAGLEIEDPRQQKVVDNLRLDPRIGEGADLLETYFEDLRTTVQNWLERDDTAAETVETPAPAAATGPPRLYLIADERDAELIGPWADGLFDEGLETIRPIFDGDEAEIREYHQENLSSCDGVVIFYGAGDELWLRRKLREIQKAPGHGRTKPPPPVCICLVGPRTGAKERFRTHEALVVPQWDGCTIESLRPFVTTVKAGGSV